MMKKMYIKSAVICCSDNHVLAPFQLSSHDIDTTLIPAAMRRRTSMTTRMAITAATLACRQAQVDGATLSSVFASLGGEIQVTDALCRLLPDDNELLSPTQFHNSVHNTTAGYWSILNHCQAPAIAIAAADDTFAMGLLEAGSQMQQSGATDSLLVCYDELWPHYLAAPIGKVAFACALVLSCHSEQSLASFSLPQVVAMEEDKLDPQWVHLAKSAPAAAAIPLLNALHNKKVGQISLNINAPHWMTELN